MRYSKFIVLIIICFAGVFTVGCLYAFVRTGTEPVVLIGAIFGFLSHELWQLAGIKKSETEGRED